MPVKKERPSARQVVERARAARQKQDARRLRGLHKLLKAYRNDRQRDDRHDKRAAAAAARGHA